MMNAPSFFPIAIPACNAGNHLLKFSKEGAINFPGTLKSLLLKATIVTKCRKIYAITKVYQQIFPSLPQKSPIHKTARHYDILMTIILH